MKTKTYIKSKFLLLIFVFILFLHTGCATYYQKNQSFNEELYKGNIPLAYKHYVENKQNLVYKNKVLLNLNKGTLTWMMEDYDTSINYFNQADLMIEDQRKNFTNEALALLINPGIKPYKVEDFENTMTNYYKAIAYLQTGKKDDALVECRRMNEKLYALNEKYKKNQQNKYSDDAFAHLMMGLIYDSSKDYNNAFIAYRNAYRTYKNSYEKLFNIHIPLQLKKDILKTAYKSGLDKEYKHFSELFDMHYKANKNGDVVVIWMSGLSPFKSEFSLSLSSLGRNGSYINFNNAAENLLFPIYIGNLSRSQQSDLLSLSTLRIAFPKYIERPLVFTEANIISNNNTYYLEKAQDVNAIAFRCLKDRMLREISNSLLRVAIKKTSEKLVNNENEYLGLLLNIVNTATESADTRNWQTLPHTIFYTRINLPEGNNNIDIVVSGNNNTKRKNYIINIEKNQTKFIIQQDLVQ